MSDTENSNTKTNRSRRAFLNSIATLTAGSGMGMPAVWAVQKSPPMQLDAINQMTLAVSDPAASVAWYQGLFGLPIVARQGPTVVLRVGAGPHSIAIGGDASDNPRITHYCLAVKNFNYDDALRILAENGINEANTPSAMHSRLRVRGQQLGGAINGTPELYFGDPDGIVVQMQDASYCGGAGSKGEICSSIEESDVKKGLLSIQEFNHFTLFVSDQVRSIQLYQSLFNLSIDTYQGALPVLRVGSGKQFLALSNQPTRESQIHHVSLAVEDFDVDRIFSVLENYGLTILGEASGATGPLQAYVTMRGANRGGAIEGTPELYFTDPDGILLQLQDLSYCGGNGVLGNECGSAEAPTGRNR